MREGKGKGEKRERKRKIEREREREREHKREREREKRERERERVRHTWCATTECPYLAVGFISPTTFTRSHCLLFKSYLHTLPSSIISPLSPTLSPLRV